MIFCSTFSIDFMSICMGQFSAVKKEKKKAYDDKNIDT